MVELEAGILAAEVGQDASENHFEEEECYVWKIKKGMLGMQNAGTGFCLNT